MSFTVKIGKEEVLVKPLVSDTLVVYYKGKESIITPHPSNGKLVWKQTVDRLPDKIVQRIGRAIEKHVK